MSLTPLPCQLLFNQALNAPVNPTSSPNFQLTLKPANGLCTLHADITLTDLNVTNSWPTIAAYYGNNELQIKWVSGTIYTLTVGDGAYSIDSLNALLETFMVANNLYLQPTTGNTTGSNMFFISLSFNLTFLATQINVTPIPTSLPTGYQLPSGATWSLPGSASTPQLIVPPITTTSSMSSFLGVVPGSYPPTVISTNYQTLGTAVPQNPVQQVLVILDGVNNAAQPGDSRVVYSFPVEVVYGTVQREIPPVPRWVNLNDNARSYITCTLVDQLLRPLPMLNNNWAVSFNLIQRRSVS